MQVSVENYNLDIDLAACRLDISHKKLGNIIRGAGCAYQGLQTGLVEPYRLSPESESRTDAGAWVSYRGPGDSGCTLRMEGMEGGVLMSLEARLNERVGRIAPLVVEGEGSGVVLGENLHHWRFFRSGYQSWSPSGSLGILEAEPTPPLSLFTRAVMHPSHPFKPKGGKHHVDWATVLYNPTNGKCVLVGFLSARKYLSAIELEVVGQTDAADRLELRAYSDGELAAVREGEEVRTSEKLWIAAGDDPHQLWEKYLELAGREMKARIPEKVPTGWCSWYHYFTKVTEKDVSANLDQLAERKNEVAVDVVQLDDGYCPVGDWLEWNDKFPSGPEKLASAISGRGFIPGLWLAPFICARGSKTYRENSDLLLKDWRDKPVLASLNPMWKGVAYYPLDLTNPKAIDYVKRVMSSVREWGYRYVKIDFVYAALLRGRRHDPAATGVEAYRAGLEAIRESLGDDVLLLGCGAPLLPSVGYVDMMRISADVAPKWRDAPLRAVVRAPVEPACENAVHGAVCRSAMHRRWWINDPDCLLVRRERNKLTLDEIRTLATAMFLSGGMVLVSDDLTGVDEERFQIIRAALPGLETEARPVDLFGNHDPMVYHLQVPGSDRHLVALINWKDKRADVEAPIEKIDAHGDHHAFEFWRGAYLGISDRKLGPFHLPPHSCYFITMIPRSDKPRVLSTSFHMSQGAMGIAEEKLDGDNMEISLELPGKRSGYVYVICPGEGMPRKAWVEFEDSGKVSVPVKK